MSETGPELEPEDVAGASEQLDTPHTEDQPTPTQEVVQPEIPADNPSLESIQPASPSPELAEVEERLSPLFDNDKFLGMKRFLEEAAVKVSSAMAGGSIITDGTLCMSSDGRIGEVTKRYRIKDPIFDRQRNTLLCVVLRYPDGSTSNEEKSFRPIYETIAKVTIPAEFQDKVQVEYEGQTFSLGDYVKVKGVRAYVGKIAAIPDQKRYPGCATLYLSDLNNHQQLYMVDLGWVEKCR